MTVIDTKIAAIQMVSVANIKENLQQAEDLVSFAAAQGAKFVVLPENFATFTMANLNEIALAEQQGNGPLLAWAQRLSKKLDIWLVAGTLPLFSQPFSKSASENFVEPDSGNATNKRRVYAASCLFSPNGELVCRYNKMHLFDVLVGDSQGRYCESEVFIAGDQPVSFQLPWAMLGLSVCYDLRFPELYRYYQRSGCDIVTVPSAFTEKTGEAHWQVLLQARAIENQCYIVAANQGGVHDTKRRTWGHSMIIDPWGEILDCCEKGPGVVFASVSSEKLTQVRQQMPVAEHRRLD